MLKHKSGKNEQFFHDKQNKILIKEKNGKAE